MSNVILIDGNSLMYKVYYATKKFALVNSKGVYTNAIYAFINTLDSLLSKQNYDYILVAFDAGKKTFRNDLFDLYKDGRAKTPDDLLDQIPLIKKYLDLKGIPRYECPGIEADDIIGISLDFFKDANISIYSSDRDMLQLVGDNTTVYLTKQGVKNLDEYNSSNFYSKMGLYPNQIPDFKALSGDSSDNLKGVKDFGPKTTVEALSMYSNLEGVYDNIASFSKKRQDNLLEYKEQAFLCKKLATILRSYDLNIDKSLYVKKEEDLKGLYDFYSELEFNSLLKKLNVPTFNIVNYPYEVINSEDEFKKILEEKSYIYLEFLDFNYHRSPIIGISYKPFSSNTSYVLDLNLINTFTFKDYIESSKYEKVTYDLKRLLGALSKYHLKPFGFVFDLLLTIYISNPSLDTSTFSSSVSSLFPNLIEDDEVIFNKGKKRAIPDINVLNQYISNKVSLIKELEDKLSLVLKEKDQLHLLYDIELPLSYTLSDMELEGVLVSKKELENQEVKISKKIFEIDQKIYDLVGVFNINSPKQLKEILFDKLNLMSGGKSTDISVLEKLIDKHPVIPLIIEHRKLSKLLSSYIQNISSNLFTDSKIHTIYQQTLTRTGRLSSVEPNMQNLPARSDFQKELRKAFISSPSTTFYSFDYSQIELRVLAEIADVKHFKEAFYSDLDVHKETAKKIFKHDDISPVERQKAKACNFGIIYGIGAFGLSNDLKISVQEAKSFIDSYFLLNPEIKDYQENTLEFVKKNKYVSSLFKRRRYIDLDKGSFFEKENNKRVAINTPIQSSAADIIKIAMINISKELKEKNLKSRLVMQIHDELILEVFDDEIDEVLELVKRNMLNIKGFNLKLDVSKSFGKDLFEI